MGSCITLRHQHISGCGLDEKKKNLIHGPNENRSRDITENEDSYMAEKARKNNAHDTI